MTRKQFSNDPGVGIIELGIRPESLILKEKVVKPSVNSSEAQVDEVSFFGDYTQYKVKLLSSGDTLIVSEMQSVREKDWTLGDQVVVTWDPKSLVGFV